MKRQATVWEKIFAEDISVNDSNPKYTKKTLSNTKINNVIKKKRAKDFNRHLTKELKMANKHIKRCSRSCHQRNKKKKNPLNITIYVLEGSKSRTLKTPNAAADVEQ